MYLIQYVKYDNDYEAFEQRDEYFDLGFVRTEEEAKEICNRYDINFEYRECDMYDTPEQFFEDHIKWCNTIHLTIGLDTKSIDIDVYSNPDYTYEVYRQPHYQIDTSGRNIVSVSISFNTDNEIDKFNKDTINFVLKHLFQSDQKINKKIVAEEVLKLFVNEVNKQYNLSLELKDKIRDYGQLT